MTLRILRRQWRFTALATAVLAIGLGASTGLFSFVNALYFRGLPVAQSERLVYIYRIYPNGNHGPIRKEQIDVLAEGGTSLATFAGHARVSSDLGGDAGARVTTGEAVDGRYFSVLGVSAAVGRVINPEDTADDAPPVVVISDRFWRQRLGGRPDVVGHVISFGQPPDSESRTIVGVLKPQFNGLSDPVDPSQFWTPLRGRRYSSVVIARLNAGVSIERFRAFIESRTPLLRDLVRSGVFPNLAAFDLDYEARNLRFGVFQADAVQMPSDPRATLVPVSILLGLTGIAALVLFIATMNVAGLLVVRGVLRGPEIATRRALGVSTAHLMGQLLAEAVALTILAGGLGLVAGAAVISIVQSVSATPFGRPVVVDWRVVGFCVLLCGGTAIVLAIAPIVQALRSDLVSGLRGGTGGTAQVRWLARMVIPQVGLAFTLLLVAGVHLRAMVRIETGGLGHDVSGSDVVQMRPLKTLRQADEDEHARSQRALVRALIDRSRGIPGVQLAGLVDQLPFRGYRSAPTLEVRSSSGRTLEVPVVRASGDYFSAMGIRLVAGRTFDARDDVEGAATAIASRGLVMALWSGEPGVGHRVTVQTNGAAGRLDGVEIVGVVGDVRGTLDVTMGSQPLLYLPIGRESSSRALSIVVKGGSEDGQLGQRVRSALQGNTTFRVASVRSLDAILGELLYPRRFAAATLVGAGWVGLALAAIGLFGQVSFSVARRRRELGVRAALGAVPNGLRWLVLREGWRATAVGIMVGAPFAVIGLIVSNRVIPGLPVVDGPTMIAVPSVMALVVLVACYVPSRQAAGTDPATVLRED